MFSRVQFIDFSLSLFVQRSHNKMKSTKVQTLGELRMRGTTNRWAGLLAFTRVNHTHVHRLLMGWAMQRCPRPCQFVALESSRFSKIAILFSSPCTAKTVGIARSL